MLRQPRSVAGVAGFSKNKYLSDKIDYQKTGGKIYEANY